MYIKENKASGGKSPWRRLLSVSVAAATAEAVTFPIDFIKTRLQLHDTKVSRPFHAIKNVITQRGILGMYTGVGAGVLRHVPYTTTRVFLYERLTELSAQPSSSPSRKLSQSLMIAFISGGTGQLIASPFDLVKVRLVADAALPIEKRRYSRGVLDAFTIICRQEGFRGMWKGCGPAVQRAALVNLGELSTYDQVKKYIVGSGISGGDTPAAHVLSSLCSGFASSVISTPADVIKTKMMNQQGMNLQYRNSLDCLVKSFRQDGLQGLYRGFFPTWIRLGPWQLVFWVTYERLKAST